jgi:hypothetical protein
MAYNAQYGCCGFSYWQHNNAAKAAANGEDWKNVDSTTWKPTYKNLIEAYFAYGIAQGEPGPDPDEGVSNAAMFAWAYKLGLIDGYLEVPIEYADWFAMTFHGAAVGQVLDGNQAISDFNAKPRIPWAAMGKSDGHDTLLIEGDGEGNGAEITWGGVQPFELSYRETNWTDVWVIIDKEDPNVDQAKLAAVLQELHGVVNVAPAEAESESLLERVEDAFKSIPQEFKDAIKILHKVIDAAMEKESVAVIEKLLADFLKTYAKSL